MVRRNALSASTPALRATATVAKSTSPISASAARGSAAAIAQLVDLLTQRLEGAVHGPPLEPPAGGPALDLGGTGQGRQRGGDVIVDAGPGTLLGRFQLLPVDEHLVGARDVHLAEDVRMTVDQLLGEPFGDVVHVPAALICSHLRMEHDLQQQVAQLVTDRVVVVGIDRLQQFVRLFEQVQGQCLVRLLSVPWTTAGTAEARHDPDQVEQACTAVRRWNGTLGDVGEQLVRPRGIGGHGAGVSPPVAPLDPDGACVALGSVLSIGTIFSCSVSYRPYLGLTSRPPSSICERTHSVKSEAAWL